MSSISGSLSPILAWGLSNFIEVLILLAQAAGILTILLRPRRHNFSSLAWILGILGLPKVTLPTFFLFGLASYIGKVRKRSFSKKSSRRLQLEPSTSNEPLPYTTPEDTWNAWKESIETAQQRIDLMMYIYRNDRTGIEMRELLLRAASRGVRVRVLVDSLGSRSLPSDFFPHHPKLQFRRFGSLRFKNFWLHHYRNHRKMILIDPEATRCLGFLGSQNIGDEYFHAPPMERFEDFCLGIRGSVVRDLAQVFQEDWNQSPQALLSTIPNIPEHSPEERFVQILATGPETERYAFEQVLLTLLFQAKSLIQITTPYLIPSPEFLIALHAASRRGVRIEFLLPKASDHPLTDAISRSWWGEFQEIEALLWLYPRRIHAKTLVIDRRVLLLGSANMDLRSFRINYECSVVLSDHSLGDRLSRHFDQQKSQSRLSPPRKRTPTARILTSLGRMASPLF